MANILQLAGSTINLVSAVVTLPSTNVYSTTTTTVGLINGKFVTTLGAQTTQSLPTTDASTGSAFVPVPANKATVLVIGQKAANTIQMCQGSIVDTFPGVTTTVGAFKDVPNFPALPDDFLPLAYALVRTAPDAAAWTPGTSSVSASGVTVGTVQNIGLLPSRPQIA